MSKIKDWMALNQDIKSEWSDMSTCLFLYHYKSQTKCVGLVQSGHYDIIEIWLVLVVIYFKNCSHSVKQQSLIHSCHRITAKQSHLKINGNDNKIHICNSFVHFQIRCSVLHMVNWYSNLSSIFHEFIFIFPDSMFNIPWCPKLWYQWKIITFSGESSQDGMLLENTPFRKYILVWKSSCNSW